jgi:branched-chain amino acid transport system ATP-binding protein
MADLRIQNLDVYYGNIQALCGVSLEVHAGEIVCLIGANGAGKTTCLSAISGLLKPRSGRVYFGAQDITGHPAHETARAGLVHVPEGRRIFANLSVAENLLLGAYTRHDQAGIATDRKRVFKLFPILQQRHHQAGGTLSGGEQQMLAIGRALMAHPSLLLLDEPSLGIAPVLVRQIFDTLQEINHTGVTMLLVEQNAHLALSVAARGYVLETGRVVLAGTSAELAGNEMVKKAYLGE